MGGSKPARPRGDSEPASTPPPRASPRRDGTAHRTRAPNVVTWWPQSRPIGTYALVALDAQIAGSGRGRAAVVNVVMARVGVRSAAPDDSIWRARSRFVACSWVRPFSRYGGLPRPGLGGIGDA
jgi:hypothetical protein